MPSPLTFLKSLTSTTHHTNEEPTTAPRKGILRRNPAKLKKSTIQVRRPADQGHLEQDKGPHVSASNSPLDEQGRDEGHGVYGIPFHSSIPNASVDGWRNFPPPHRVDSVMMKGGRPASQPRQSEGLSENPIVSHYYTTSQTERPPAQITGPMPPSRTWSTIPSVQRESSHVRTTAHPSFAPSVARDQSTPFRQSGNSERSSLVTVGHQPSEFEHERRFIEYPSTPYAKRANLTHPSNSASLQDKSTSLRRANTVTIQDVPEPIRQRRVHQPTIQADAGLDYRDEMDSDPEVYHYIVPVGVDVIFQDEDGNQITRTGETVKTPVRNRPLKSAPIIVHDEFGTFLYRDPKAARPKGSSRRQDRNHEGMPVSHSARDQGLHGTETALPSWILASPASLSPRSKIIKIDPQGNQTILNKSTNISTHGR